MPDSRPIVRDSVVGFCRHILAVAGRIPAEALVVSRSRIAGMTVEACFGAGAARLAGPYRARLGLPAEADEQPADHRFLVLTAADLGLPALPTWDDQRLPHLRFQEMMATAGLRVEYPHTEGIWRILDLVSGRGILALNSTESLPPWDRGAPLLTLVRFAIETRGLRLAHAATLGAGGRGVLMVGDGGAGKSGTTLAGLAAGLQTAGDDYVALGFEGERPVARMLYRVLKQDRRGLERHAGNPVAVVASEPNWQGKIEIDPQLYFPGCFAERLELRAVLVPRIAERSGPPEIVPVSAGEAMRTLMRSNLFQFGERETGLGFFARLLRLPCYRIVVGPDVGANGAALARLVGGLPS